MGLEKFEHLQGYLNIVVINNMDDVLFILLAVTCDQQHSVVWLAIHIVLRPSNGWQH